MRIFFAFLLVMVLTGCQHRKFENLHSLPLQVAGSSPDTLTLTSKCDRLVLRAGSSAAILNEVAIQLDHPVQCDAGGNWSLHPDTIRDILLPVLNRTPRRIKTILIDPGHGGHDNGAVSASGLKEKELNLALAREIAAALKKQGFAVYLTRNRDKFVSLDERPAMIGRVKADLFISVHHNASATNPGAAGMETFVLRAETTPEKTLTARTLRGAYLVQQKQQTVNPASGRGVKFARFKVLRLATCPAMLIEAGFLSNPAEAKRCASPAFQRRLAANIALAIKEFAAGL